MKKFFLFSIILAFIFYFSGIGFDLPFLKVVSDEDSYVGRIVDMAEKGIWNPKWFYYPPLYYYFVAITAIIAKLIASIFIYFFGIKDVINGILSNYPNIVLYAFWGRFISAFFGFLSCLLIFKIIKEEFRDELLSNLALLLMAVSPPLILHSHFAKPDTMQVFLILVAFYFSLKIYKEGGASNSILAGIFTSSSFMTKYSGVVVGGTVCLAIFLRFFEKKDTFKFFLRNSILSFLSFLIFIPIFSPFTILDFPTFKRDFILQAKSYQIDPLILSENAWLKQILNIKNLLGILPTIFFIYGLIICFKRSFKKDFSHLILLSFPLLFYIQLGITNQWVERHFLPALPFLIFISCIGFTSLLSFFKSGKIPIIMGAFIFIFSIQSIIGSLNYLTLFHQKDPRHLNREWVEKNIPPGIFFAFEERTGLSPTRFGRLFYSFGESNFEGFLDSPFELLFVSEGIRAQYIEGKKKEKFPLHLKAYRWIEENSYLIKVIGKRGYDEKPKIFLYKLKGGFEKEGSPLEMEIEGENRSGNTFFVMVSKRVIAKIEPNSKIHERKKFNFKDEKIPIFIFTPVDKDGKGKDGNGFSYKINVIENGKLISSFMGESFPNQPSIYLSKK